MWHIRPAGGSCGRRAVPCVRRGSPMAPGATESATWSPTCTSQPSMGFRTSQWASESSSGSLRCWREVPSRMSLLLTSSAAWSSLIVCWLPLLQKYLRRCTSKPLWEVLRHSSPGPSTRSCLSQCPICWDFIVLLTSVALNTLQPGVLCSWHFLAASGCQTWFQVPSRNLMP